MRRGSVESDNKSLEYQQHSGSQNWLLHVRYVRGEHEKCTALADKLLQKTNNTHRYAYFVKGMVLAESGSLQEALEKFHSCIRLQTHDPEPVKQVARCLYRQGRYQLALEANLEAEKMSIFPDPEIYCALDIKEMSSASNTMSAIFSTMYAECASALGDVVHGVEWARAAVGANGGERAGALLARLLLETGDVEAALRAYDDALSSNACGADTLAAAGALRLRAGDPRRAFQLLGAALALQPTQHSAALALAAMMLEHKDVDAALARLKIALAAHPGCVAAHTNLGLALLAKKKYVAALTCLHRAVTTAPLSARAAHDLGLALLMCRRPTSAFCRLAAAVALQPSQPYSVLLLAIALERLGDTRADSAYEHAVSLAPDNPLIRLNLAGRYARAGRVEQAATEAVLTAELLTNNSKLNVQLSSSLRTLLTLLEEAGVDVPELNSRNLDANAEATAEEQEKALDEV